MTEPKRWLEGGDAEDDALALLRAARPPVPLGAEARRRSGHRVAALGVVPIAAAFGWWPALALGAVLGASGSFAVTRLMTSEPAPSETGSARRASSTNSATAPIAEAPAFQYQPSEVPSSPTPAPPGPAVRSPVAPAFSAESASESASANALQEEIRLLEQARRNLADSPGAARLALLDHERRFPGGHLRIERELLLVDSLVRLGRHAEAEARAASLERQNANSLYRERLDQILGKRPK
ncbi:MAG TPA: hypothetical protein VJN18_26005 [Polyangiaceae bacterium]|nr:hypothetical protein [Polyangiaceae bacterium]